MLYELIAVVRRGNLMEVREIAKTAGMIVLNNGGVVRGYTNWDQLLLPKRTTKHQAQHYFGHYFVMRFDANPATQAQVRKTLGLDPRMIKFSVVKLGDKLSEVAGVSGTTYEITQEATLGQ
ncbi:hypothetical protein RUND412_004469 [Rhizina undulata]